MAARRPKRKSPAPARAPVPVAAKPSPPPPQRPKKTVLLVDDHPLVRTGLAQLINRQDDLAVIGEADSAAAAISAVDKLKPDLAVVDISLDDRNGIDLLKDLVVRAPKLNVLMLSMHPESLYAERALRAGAKGYIMKQEAPDKVLVALRRIVAGDVYVSDTIAAKMLRTMTDRRGAEPHESPVERLSDRELEVFRYIGKGFGTREIAEKLFLSVKTVETHREHIKAKLKLANKGELLRYAVQWVADQD
jgi:DNA-binding NarL/FixJ family response regulator